MGTETTRRTFLASAAGVAAVAATPRWARAASTGGVQPVGLDAAFPFGVASGDPLADRVILWTWCREPQISWEVARDPEFTTIVRSGSASPLAANDYTVHVDVDGLTPATSYWYKFVTPTTGTSSGNQISIGRTRTLPAANAALDRLRVGVVTCSEWEFGFFGGYRVVAERDDLDVVLALGDYIYEFGTDYGGIPSPKPAGRTHTPEHELETLDDYRARYRQYRLDAGLRQMHAAHPVIAIYDDHEVANDWWRDGAQAHDPATEGDFHARRDAGLQAFYEYLPIRRNPADATIAYRRFQVGDLVDLFMIDDRRYRDEQPTNAVVGYFSVDPATDDPNRTMLGAAQYEWLVDGLEHSPAIWKVLGNPDSMMPVDVGPALAGALSTALSGLGTPLPPVPPPLLVDGWDGYNGERTKLLNAINDKKIKDVVVLTGDYHESFATQLPHDRSSYELDGNSAAVEFIAPSITSPGLSETLQMASLPQALTINTVFEANLTASNPWVKYHEGFSNGFGVAEFRRDGMQFDFWFVEDRNAPDTTAHAAASWTVARGASVLAAAAGPLGPRPAAAAGSPPAGATTIPATGGDQRLALGAAAAATLAAAALRASKQSAE